MDEHSRRVAELIDKADITDVVNSYFRAPDEKNFDVRHLAAVFTSDARVARPNGASLIGPAEISASHEKSFTRFEGSQHLLTGHHIAVHGDTATLRANLVAIHMWQGARSNANNPENFFAAGGTVHASLVKTDGQWKISELRTDIVWRAGGFKDMAQTR